MTDLTCQNMWPFRRKREFRLEASDLLDQHGDLTPLGHRVLVASEPVRSSPMGDDTEHHYQHGRSQTIGIIVESPDGGPEQPTYRVQVREPRWRPWWRC